MTYLSAIQVQGVRAICKNQPSGRLPEHGNLFEEPPDFHWQSVRVDKIARVLIRPGINDLQAYHSRKSIACQITCA